MKEKKLLLVTIIICIAAGLYAAGALTFSSFQEESVGACFVSADTFESLISKKERKDFDVSAVQFEGQPLPYDEGAGVLYIPQSCDATEWEGSLQTTIAGGKIYILGDAKCDRQQCIREGRTFRIAVVNRKTYMESKVLFTGLPVIEISHSSGSIEGKEKHDGTIRVLDPYRKEYQASFCTFHVRGNTSVYFDKKSYRVELHDKSGGKADKSFLGLRSDDDWILNSMATDKTLCREKVCYDLWEKLNGMEERPVASAMIEYAELFINGAYMGVYGLMYPVDGKLMGMKQGDILYKVSTWKEELDAPGKLTDYNGLSEVLNTSGFAYASIKYPGSDSGPYIWDPFQSYQDMVFETGDIDAMQKEGVSVDRENFVLHELFCEMTRAGDNTWKNLFLAAYADEKGGYVLRETIWDLNYTFGDIFTWDLDNGNTLFYEEGVEKYKLRYDRDYGYSTLAASDPSFLSEAADKWRKWRENGIGPEYVGAMFAESRSCLERSGAMQRNNERWSVGVTEQDFDRIEKWLTERFAFLDRIHETDNGK